MPEETMEKRLRELAEIDIHYHAARYDNGKLGRACGVCGKDLTFSLHVFGREDFVEARLRVFREIRNIALEEAAKRCDEEESAMRKSAESADNVMRLAYREGGYYAAARLTESIRSLKTPGEH